ncbi:MAG: hypothetical protein SFT93_05480 [Rickettsiaceae bacterium]|nr:hypothetical protein [Rickettsiaceae bacterium]
MSSPRKRGSRENVIPVKTGIQGKCHPRENGDPGKMSSPRKRGSRKYSSSRFPPPRE